MSDEKGRQERLGRAGWVIVMFYFLILEMVAKDVQFMKIHSVLYLQSVYFSCMIYFSTKLKHLLRAIVIQLNSIFVFYSC